jgi:ribose/xylose/arabinose/galactoside ABC-type transport system permease subunit
MGRILITIGVLLIIAGLAVTLLSKTGINLGRLPGDINIRKDGYSFHFPIVSSIIISIILTILLNIFFRK